MTVEDAIDLVERLLERGRLTKIQDFVFRGTWDGETYAYIARATDYDEGHVKDVGAELWRSLRSAPPVNEVLDDLIQVLSTQQTVNLPSNVEGKLSQFIALLQQHRCLIILDNFEAVLENKIQTGSYRVGYENYGDLLDQTGTIAHQSQIILTSREKPREVATLEGIHSTVRSLTYSPDKRFLALSSRTSAIHLWNVQTGECYQTLAGHQDFARLLKFSPDGTILASCNYQKSQH